MAPYIEGMNDKHLSSKWSELGETQKSKLQEKYGSDARSTFSEARSKMTADKPKNTPVSETSRMNPETDDIFSYDTKAYGSGSNKGTQKLSASDLRNLKESGYSNEEIVDYSNKVTSSGDVKQGDKAQALLEKYKTQFTNDTPEETPKEVVETSPPQSGGNTTIDNSNNSNVIQPGDDEQSADTIGGGGTAPPSTGGGSQVIDSGNTTIEDSFNGGTVNTGDITSGGDTNIDNSNNSNFQGGDSDNKAIGGTTQPEQKAQEFLSEKIEETTSGAATPPTPPAAVVNNSGNTDIEDSFNGGDINTGDITSGRDTNIDNSNNSRYYGGDSTNISIDYGNKDSSKVSTLSDLTMFGYGKPSDSPGSQASFVDRYTTQNADNQKKSKDFGSATANKYIQFAAQNNPIDYAALNTSISQGIQNMFDLTDIQENMYMGDKGNYKPPVFKMPKSPKSIESNVGDLADEYSKKLGDMD